MGNNVRYDGGHKLEHYLRDTFGQFIDWVPVCPEAECGLPVPREAMDLVGDPRTPRLVTRVTGIDHTDRMLQWANKKLKALENEHLCGFVLKARSPSCSVHDTKLYSRSGRSFARTAGLFTETVMGIFPLMPFEDEEGLQDPGVRENFIERVFVYQRWQELMTNGKRIGQLVAFHASHKYILMAHSLKHLKELGSLVSNPRKYRPAQLYDRYFQVMMDGLKLQASVKKHVNVLQHMAGYFKKQLSPDEKLELQDVIAQYGQGLVPLLVPITLIKHYAGTYDDAYLKQQHYLKPHPLELMLRNHA